MPDRRKARSRTTPPAIAAIAPQVSNECARATAMLAEIEALIAFARSRLAPLLDDDHAARIGSETADAALREAVAKMPAMLDAIECVAHPVIGQLYGKHDRPPVERVQ